MVNQTIDIIIPNFNRKEYNLNSFYDKAIENKTQLVDERKDKTTIIEKEIFNFVPDNNCEKSRI